MSATAEMPRCPECGALFEVDGSTLRICTMSCTFKRESPDDDWRLASAPKLRWEPPPVASKGPPPAVPRSFPRTDAGNGELFAAIYGDQLRFDHRRKRWLVWRGHWWAEDANGEVRTLAKLATRQRYHEATQLADLRERSEEARFAITSESRQRLDAMMAQAQAEPPLSVAGDHWDVDPLLFAGSNGIVDLRTGASRTGLPKDEITLHTDVMVDATAVCPRWMRFLDEVFRGDADLIDFIWRAVGYSLTGDTREQCVFTCYGTGSNGKTVFLNILQLLAGRYAYNIPFQSLEFQSRASIPNDIAALVGARLVTASETNDGVRLNEARLKSLTGGDPITARFLHQEYFTFVPVAKFWLAVNHRPRVTDTSHGFWRRIRLIPFLREFKKDADPHLLGELIAELPGILNWAVSGALAWQARGLEAPPIVVSATESYRLESDPVAQFIADCCLTGDGFRVRAKDLFEAYARWAKAQGMTERETLTSTKFGRRLGERFEKKRDGAGATYLGLGLMGDRFEVGPTSSENANAA